MATRDWVNVDTRPMPQAQNNAVWVVLIGLGLMLAMAWICVSTLAVGGSGMAMMALV